MKNDIIQLMHGDIRIATTFIQWLTDEAASLNERCLMINAKEGARYSVRAGRSPPSKMTRMLPGIIYLLFGIRKEQIYLEKADLGDIVSCHRHNAFLLQRNGRQTWRSASCMKHLQSKRITPERNSEIEAL